MGSFQRAFLGYRRAEVDAAIASRENRIGELEREMCGLSEMVLSREREAQTLRDALREANERHDRSLAALQTVAMRVEEIHAQARGQATRMRMRALREAIEIDRRVQDIASQIAAQAAADAAPANGKPAQTGSDLFEGLVEVEIGPLGDFSQLVGFEDAAGKIGATSEISIRRFSEGRATLSMRLDEPVELLRELEERSPMDFQVRKNEGDRVILDLDDDEAQAA